MPQAYITAKLISETIKELKMKYAAAPDKLKFIAANELLLRRETNKKKRRAFFLLMKEQLTNWNKIKVADITAEDEFGLEIRGFPKNK